MTRNNAMQAPWIQRVAMTGKKNSGGRKALILAFAAGAVTGAAGTLTIRRRWQGGSVLIAGDFAAPPAEPILTPTGSRFDAVSPDSDGQARLTH